jgi:hypothetical protein
MSIPDRSMITSGRWTGIEYSNTIDTGLFLIMQIRSLDSDYKVKTTNVYLSPGFTEASTNPNSESPWDVYEQGPLQLLSGLAPGVFGLEVPGNSSLALDPAQFAPAAVALMDAENFYLNAEDTFQFVSENLAGNANSFQGQAGGAFAQLMQDFANQSSYASLTMGLSSGMTAAQYQSYSGLVLQAGSAAGTFLTSLYNNFAAWTQLTTHSPLGSILQALINNNIMTGTPGNYKVNNEALVDSPVGDLTTDSAWQQIEDQAKQIWLTEVGILDLVGRYVLNVLQSAYADAADKLVPLTARTSTPIDSDLSSGTNSLGGLGGLNNLFSGLNNIFSGLDNLFGGAPNNLFSGLDNLFGGAPNNLFSGLDNLFGGAPNNLFSGLDNLFSGAPNNLLSGLGGSPNSSVGSGLSDLGLVSQQSVGSGLSISVVVPTAASVVA